tara:strand:- start:5097 stop:6002 length:906 start_codon:yes stop_codon:yes gene_type:complete
MTRIADELVSHARFSSAMTAILAVTARAVGGDPQILPLMGPTRVGKTTLLAQAIQDITKHNPNGLQSVINVVSPKHLTGRALPDACLTSIGMSAGMFVNHVAATNAFIKAVNKRGTCLIIFDETQHMLERGSSTTVRAAADFLKGLFDQTQASIVLAGLPTLSGLFNANEQLADRARRPFEFYPYDWHGDDYRQFRAALAAALEHLKDTGWCTFDVKDPEFAQRMYVASAGRFGLISKIFMEVQASGIAGEALYPAFTAAYDNAVMGRLIGFNPFDTTHEIQTEHMATVYANIMLEAGVKI